MNIQTQLQSLSEFTAGTLSTRSIENLNKIIVESAKKLTDAQYCIIFLKTGDKLEDGYPSDPILKNIFTKKNIKDIYKIKKPITEPNGILQDIAQEIKQYNIQSFLIIPLGSGHDDLGTLFLASVQPNHFKNIDSQIIKTFASIATLAIKQEVTKNTSKKALELRDRFISLASHELRTPMTSITGYIQLLYSKMKKNNQLEPRWIEALYTESIRMNSLIKELLDINRIKQGQFAFFFDEVKITDAIHKAIERYQTTHPEFPILFKNELPDNDTIIGDFDKLVEMTSGIISNAIKFSRPGSKIIITLKPSNRTIILTIKDHGKGISKDDLGVIFEGFFKSNNPNIEGMGVGLFLAKNIVDHHRGKLQVISKPNKGTTIKITLPRTKA